MKTILFCLDFYYPHLGGAEVLFTALAEGLARSGWRVQIVTQRVSNTSAHEVRNGVEIFRVRSFRSRYFFSLLCIPLLWKLAGQADILHATTFASTFPAWLVSRLRRKPMVLTVHEVWVGHWKQYSDASPLFNWINDKIERMIYTFDYGHYVAVSHATERGLLAIDIPPSKITVIYNGLDYGHWTTDGRSRDDVRRRLQLDPNFVFFFSGRPGCSKGLPVLLKAFASVHERHPATRLLALVSRAPAVQKGFQEAQELIRNLNIGDAVTLLPPVSADDLPNYVYAADTVVVPSLSEGFGFAAAEACAMKRPVIVSDNASLPEVVSGSVLAVPPAQPERLSEAMEKALLNQFDAVPEKKFLHGKTLQSHIELYQTILQKPVHSDGSAS